MNKRSGHFDQNDERMFTAILIYCGLGIQVLNEFDMFCIILCQVSTLFKDFLSHAIKAVKIVDENRTSAYRAQVALDVLSYHSCASPREASKVAQQAIPEATSILLDEFYFDPLAMADDDSPIAVVRMFVDLGLMEHFHIHKKTLCSFLLSVRKSYRNVAYHNWKHALGVTQTAFATWRIYSSCYDKMGRE